MSKLVFNHNTPCKIKKTWFTSIDFDKPIIKNLICPYCGETVKNTHIIS